MAPEIPTFHGGQPTPSPKPRPGVAAAQVSPPGASPVPGPVRDGVDIAAFGDPFADSVDEDLAREDDAATTADDWCAPEKPVFDFGHAPCLGTLWHVTALQEVVWADNGKRVTPSQADRMPALQREAYYRLIGHVAPPPRRP